MLPRLKRFFRMEELGAGVPWRIFWVALVVRLLYLTLAHTYRIRVILDHFQFGWEMGRIARALVTGRGFADPFLGHTGPTAWISPLYPLILAAVFKLFGIYTPASAWVILAINSVFSALTALAVYEIGMRCYNRSVALWSGWLWALYPAAIQYAVHWVWDMCLATCLFAWAIVIALRIRGVGKGASEKDSQTAGRWAVFGLLWGAILLSNPSLVTFLPACGLWMLWGVRHNARALTRSAGYAVLAGCLAAVCLAPWIWRNWETFHAWIPTRGNFGAELYQSVLPENQGFPWGTTLPLAESHPEFIRYRTMGEVAYVREKNEQAKDLIRANPRRFLSWIPKRIYFFWASVPHAFEKSAAIEIVREINFGFLSVTGLLGLALSIKQRVPGAYLFAAAFLFVPLVYYVVTVQARFRHPLEPLITLFTVYLFQSAERGRLWSGRAAWG